jgi:hypothetical protein
MKKKGTLFDMDRVVLLIAERLRDKATEQGRIPFESGDLRKDIHVEHLGYGKAAVGSGLVYARAVHDGRPAITIRPNLKKNPPRGDREHKNRKRARLKFSVGGKTVFAKEVNQPARKGQPFLQETAEEMQKEGWDWLISMLTGDLSRAISMEIPKSIQFKVKI